MTHLRDRLVSRPYISGPMTGLPGSNFDAFYAAEDTLRGWGISGAINPAKNFGGNTELEREVYLREDIRQITEEADALVVLPGWAGSEGAVLEVLLAGAIKLPIYEIKSGNLLSYAASYGTAMNWWIHQHDEPRTRDSAPRGVLCPPTEAFWQDVSEPKESILAEADRLINGERNAEYGHPFDDFLRTGQLWGACLGQDDIAPEMVGLMMACLKVSRACTALDAGVPIKRDTLVDGPGYFGTVDMVQTERIRRNGSSAP